MNDLSKTLLYGSDFFNNMSNDLICEFFLFMSWEV